MQKRGSKSTPEQCSDLLRWYDKLCGRNNPLKPLGSVADYLANRLFYLANDIHGFVLSVH